MKKSTKLLAFLLSTCMICAVPAVISGCGDDDNGNTNVTQPENKDAVKVKDGHSVSVEKDETFEITVSEYVTANGNEVKASSSNDAVVTAALNNGKITLTGKAEGGANVTVTCGKVTLTFAVTVTAAKVSTPAPEFKDVTASLDLREKDFIEVTLNPENGGDKFDIVYKAALNDEVEIKGNVLKLTPSEVGDRTVTVTATCTEKDNAENKYDVTFKVKISVTQSKEPTYFIVSIDGKETSVEEGKTFTLPDFENVPEGKIFKGWQVGAELKQAGDVIPVNGNLIITSVLENKKYTVTIDGVAVEKEHGSVIILPEYNKQLEEGKQFKGWQVGSKIEMPGSEVTVTGNLTITAVITDIPTTPPELVKASGSVALVEGSETGTAEITVAEYIKTNGHSFKVENSNPEFATVSSTDTTITVTAKAEGNTTLTITCGSVVATITVNVTYQAPVKVKDGEKISFYLSAETSQINIADYITANKNAVSVSSSNEEVATVAVADGKVTISALAAGKTTLTLTCKDITLNFEIVVKNAVPTFENGEIEIDKYDGDTGTYTINSVGADTFTYEYAVEGATVEDGVLSVTATENKELTVSVTATDSATGEVETTSFKVTVTVIDSTPTRKGETVTDTEVHDVYYGNLILDLSENINDAKGRIMGYEVDGTPCDKDYEVTGTFGATEQEVALAVKAIYEKGTVEYTYKVKIVNTSEYRVVNGGFDNGLDGWIVSDNEHPIGAISENETFWADLPMFNDGKYLSSDGNGTEGNTGTITSSDFKVGGINKISFKLGAGNGCFVTLERGAGEVLAVWRNYKFDDVGGWEADRIGKDQFALNLVTYVADLSKWKGETVRLVINDEATSNCGFVTFDSLVTYYANESDLNKAISGVHFDAVNELADTTEITAKIAEAKAISQGDYTDESFANLQSKIADAETLKDKKGVTAQQLTDAINAIDKAEKALTERVPVEKDVVKTIALKSGTEVTIDPTQFVDTKELSAITYELSTESDKLTINGLKLTTAASEESDETVILIVKYKNEEVLSVSLTVKITSGDKPVINKDEVTLDIDLFDLEDKTKTTIDFTTNVSNPSNLTLTYTVTINGSSDVITLDENNCYNYNFGSNYTDEATEVIFNVTVGSTENALTANYTYKLNIKNTTAYRILNGGFETGNLDGWTLKNLDGSDYVVADGVTVVQNTAGYWGGAAAYNHVGEYHFNGQEGGIHEHNVYTLTSSPFIIGGSGYISFKIGGRAAVVKIYDKASDTLIAKYFNTAYADTGFENDKPHVEKGARQAVMSTFVADLSAYKGAEVYFVLEDNQYDGWGHAIMDDVVTYYETAPQIEGKFDTVKNLCKCGYNEETDTYTTTNIPWVKAENALEVNRLRIKNNFEGVAVDAGTVDLNNYLYATGVVVGDTSAQINKQILKVSDGTVDYTENFTAFVLETGKTYVVTYKLVSGVYETETSIKIFVGNKNSVTNGNFEEDMKGWTYIKADGANDFGRIVSDDYYWNNTDKTFNKTEAGGKLFTGIETVAGTNQENGVGTLKSSVFTLQQNGWITFRLGGAHNANCGIRVRNAADGSILAQFNNLDKGTEGAMDKYKYQFAGMSSDIQCYIEIFDYATEGWGLVVVDDIVTDCGATEPDGTIINNVI